jgi:hypothetical protein
MKTVISILLALLLAACAARTQDQPSVIFHMPTVTTYPTQPAVDAPCAFMEGRQPLPEISAQLLSAMKKTDLPVESARAEAYGENCITEDGRLVRFAARETDYYITFSKADLQDEANLGGMLEKNLAVIS